MSEPSGAELLRISALGLYRAFINGARVGNDLLTPGWTSYDKRLSFQTYEVGSLLRHGQNVIDIWLADGWYRSQMMWAKNPIFNTWGSQIAAIAELRGGPGAVAPLVLKTDDSWASGELPIRSPASISARSTMPGSRRSRPDKGSEAVPFDTDVLVAPRDRAGSRTEASRFRSSPGRTPRSARSTTSARTSPATSPSP